MQATRIWHLLGRKLTGDATLEELRELEQLLLQDPELAYRAEIQTRYFNNTENENSYDEDTHAWLDLQKKMQIHFPDDFAVAPSLTQQKPAIKKYRVLLIAAALLAAVAFIWQFAFNKQKNTAQANNKNVQKKHITLKGKTMTVLPDGSRVWLNNNSRIEYDKNFGISNRDIILTGEAFFDVVHKAELPMTVHAGLVDINVKGTAFNVKNYPEDKKVETSLIRGVIELSAKTMPQKILMQPNEKVVVAYQPAMKEAVGNEAETLKYSVVTLDPEAQSGLIPEVAWIENKLVFNNESFSGVAEKLERWYNIKITVENKEIEKENFTGVIENESIDTFLKALQMTYDFHYKKNNNTIIIY